jgi:hypothetical protein
MLRSADAGESIRGIGADFVVLDEVQDIDAKIFHEVIRPALADRQGHGLLIGTPKGTGNWLYDIFAQCANLDDWAAHQFTTEQGGRVTAEELASARASMDARTYRQEFLATFETYNGAVYYNFDPRQNVMDLDHTLRKGSIVSVGMDFNVDPMTAVIAYVTENSVYVYDEIVMQGSNTYELSQEILNRYPGQRVWAYPDPAGSARKTSSTTTDHNILRNSGFTVKARTRHPAVRDRINSVNSMLCNTQNVRRLVVHPRCGRVIEALTKHQYLEGTQTPNKHSGYDHISDALGYLVEFNFPLVTEIQLPPQPQTFNLKKRAY